MNIALHILASKLIHLFPDLESKTSILYLQYIFLLSKIVITVHISNYIPSHPSKYIKLALCIITKSVHKEFISF